MAVGIISSPHTAPVDSVLRDARLLNSDIGRHSVKCNFSTRLAGRFYQNGSLERHTLRKSRLVEMQAKKRRLEQELRLEERRVELLEERLGETEKAREDAHGLIITIERGVIRFQSFVRRRQALRLFATMRHEWCSKDRVARFFQRRYRGWKGRQRARDRRRYLIQKERDESATAIQARMRRYSQRNSYLDIQEKLRMRNNLAAITIQSMLRGGTQRRAYMDEIARRHGASGAVQRAWRCAVARVLTEELRQEALRKRIEAMKPKRVPLHLRRYSTYGAGNSRGGNDRHSAEFAREPSARRKREIRMRRRSSDAMIIVKDGQLSSLANLKACSASVRDPDENDSIATTITSLTNATDDLAQKRRSMRFQRRARKNPPPWHTPQRVLASPSNSKGNQPRRASLERRSTVVGGSIQKWSRERERPGKGQPPGNGQPPLTTCRGSDPQKSGSSQEGQKSVSSGSGKDKGAGQSLPEKRGDDPAPPSGEDAPESPPPTSPARREEVTKTPITVSREASFIVQDVFGKIVMRHSIVHSKFEDEFREHEDDLE